MKRLLVLLFLLAWVNAAQAQEVYQRKYGTETKLNFALWETDGTDLKVDAVDRTTNSDCNIIKDEGTETYVTNDFVDEGNLYSITLTATEMSAARISVCCIDEATKAYLDKCMIVETYGMTASAQHPDADYKTAQAGGATTIQLASAESYVDDLLNNNTSVSIVGGTGAGQTRCITDWVSSTDTATVTAWTTQPDNTSVYFLFESPNCNVNATVSAADVWSYETRALTDKAGFGLADDAITAAKIDTGAITADAIAADAITEAKIADNAIAAEHIAANAIDAGAIAADAITEAKIADNAIAAEHIAANAIDAGAIATDAITADKIAASAITSSEFAQGAADLVWGTAARALTDKSGFALSGTQTFNLTGNITGDLSGSVGSVTTVSDKTGYSGTFTLGTDGITADSVSTAAGNKIADIVLRRNTSDAESSAYGGTVARKSLLGAIAQQTHKVAISGDTMTLYKSDGTTILGTRTITSSASAAPITGVGN